MCAVIRELLFCPFCDQYFTDSSILAEHIEITHQDYLKSQVVTVTDHEVNEDAETIYICPHCLFAIDSICSSPTSSIISHIDTHSISIARNVKMTFQISSDKELIKSYIDGRVEAEIFVCPICSIILADKESLLKHLYMKHSSSGTKNVSAEITNLIRNCAKDFLIQKQTRTVDARGKYKSGSRF